MWGGKVARIEVVDADTIALRAFNHNLQVDERVDLTLVPIADGLTIARKR